MVAVLLMAVFCGINLMGIKTLARADNAATWWKIGVPMLVVLLLAVVSFHPTTFTAGGGFAPFGAKAPLAFGAFRSRLPDAARPFRLKAGGVLSPAAFVVANLIIFWSGWDTVWTLGVAVGIGCLLLAVARLLRTNPVAVRLDVRAAQWLPGHLAGTGLITWVSDFGP